MQHSVKQYTPAISVIIITRNRPAQLADCVRSILQNTFHDYQILIADQSESEASACVIKSFYSPKIEMIQMKEVGKSRGLNFLIKKAKSPILVFTDDDCIVSKTWLSTIVQTYKDDSCVVGVFGNTYPYRPQLHPTEICPLTFVKDRYTVHSFINLDNYFIGLGNNMSIRKEVFEKVGNFQEWLGPGTMVGCGEESEIIFNILKHGYTLATNPKIIVFHNRWLEHGQGRVFQMRYIRGFVSFLSFYLLSRDRRHVWKFIRAQIYEHVILFFRKCYHLAHISPREYYYNFLEALAVLEGISIGIYMAVRQFINQTFHFSA